MLLITLRTHYRATFVTFVIPEDNHNFEIFSLLVTKSVIPLYDYRPLFIQLKYCMYKKPLFWLNRLIRIDSLKSGLAEPNLSSLVIQFNSLDLSTDWFGAIRGCFFDFTNSPEWNGWFMNYLFNVVFSYTQIIIFKFLTLISYQDVWFLLRFDFSFLFLVVNILLKIHSKFWYNASWITSLTVWVNYHRFKFKLDRVFSKRFINQSIHLSESFRWIESLSNRAPLM